MSRKFYFVHIPKNAGNTIRPFCKKNGIKVITHNIRRRNKRLLTDYRAKKKLHAFCISRNPYDRVVSAYHYLRYKSRHKKDLTDNERFLLPFSGFLDFVKNGLHEAAENQLHFFPQVFWIYNQHGEPEVETTLRMENLEKDFNAFCEKMEMNPIRLRKTNTSTRQSWKKYYDEETKRIVADIYHLDFEFFNYNK